MHDEREWYEGRLWLWAAGPKELQELYVSRLVSVCDLREALSSDALYPRVGHLGVARLRRGTVGFLALDSVAEQRGGLTRTSTAFGEQPQ